MGVGGGVLSGSIDVRMRSHSIEGRARVRRLKKCGNLACYLESYLAAKCKENLNRRGVSRRC